MKDAAPTRGRRDALATLTIVGMFLALAIGRPVLRRWVPHPTPERCAVMLERWAEQEARSQNRVPVASHVDIDAPDVRRCTRDLTDAEVECALKAGYVDEIERCLP